MHRKGLWFLPAVLLIFAAGCNAPGTPTEEAPTPEVITIVVTATNPPEPTDAPVVDQGATATARQDLNVRGGPGTGYDITDFLPGGQTVPVIGKTSDGSWLQVNVDGRAGWVSAFYTDANDLSDVPVVDVAVVMADSGSGGDGGSPTEDSGSGGSGGSGGGQTAPSDSNISDTLNIKNDSKFYSDVISYPSGDTQDQVYINIQGFDSITTSGYVNYSLNCTGTGVANVIVTGGGDCNSAWTEFYTNDSHQETIKIYLNSGGNAYVQWTLVASANN